MNAVGSAGAVEIYVWRGDISTLEVDALVNPANNHLWMGAGVAGALKRGGGPDVEREAVAKGPIDIGAAISTTAGNLPAKRVIHAAVMGQDLRTSAKIIREATTSALTVASEEGLKSLALPGFGTGVGGFPREEAARQMVGAVAEFGAGGSTTVERVIFALLDEVMERVFVDEVQRRTGVS